MNNPAIWVLLSGELSAGVILRNSLATSGSFAWFILALIGLLSIMSWAVMGRKFLQFRRVQRQNRVFDEIWDAKSGDLTGVYDESVVLRSSSMARVFAEGYRDLKALAPVVDRRPRISRETVASIERGLDRVIAREIIDLERNMIVLASTANASPLLGLLGTVWGILHTFWMIGLQHNTDIGTVAPGISAALITTVFGLVAAIPAVIGYNFFQSRTNEIVLEMEDFSSRYVSLLERNIAREQSPVGKGFV